MVNPQHCQRAAEMDKPAPQAFVYRISTADEWAQLQRTGGTLGGDLDRSTGCIHLSDLSQLSDGLVYEAADDSNYFPHFYGPGRSFAPLQLDAVIKAEKIVLVNNDFTCSLLDGADPLS
ncbi:uncharacterized protein LOC127767993 isoform X2 [Oryza glaberrima]|uniref:uncharacterized protein LOC127767993 isoform X2 n=1 Tax=Oryza glaberrima TaxID=4538 RepID=UPI00224C30E9|nr:uncharacterized protein LOC127767993 isoform X2 [Oryza glaberrima]